MVKYPLAHSTINNQDIDALIKWLKTYPRLTKGELTEQFQNEWAEYIGTEYSVFCNSGSSANLLALLAILTTKELKNRNVVIPSTGWVTSIAPVLQAGGLNPIMLDSDPNTFGINLDDLEKECKLSNPSIVLFVQSLGVPHDKDRLLKLKEKYGFYLIEDACASLGAKYYDGTNVGQIGDVSTFSFYFGHQLSTIEGGMINTDDKDLRDVMVMLRSHGWNKDNDPDTNFDYSLGYKDIDKRNDPFIFFLPGYNLRSTDLQAFLGLLQLKKADEIFRKRHYNHILYAKYLSGVVKFQDWGEDYPCSIHFCCIAKDIDNRHKILNALDQAGIENRVFSAGNLGKHPFWRQRYPEFKGKVATMLYERGFFLPNYPELSNTDIQFITNVVKDNVEK